MEESDQAFPVTGLAMVVHLQHSVAGADPDFGGLKLIQFLGPSVKKECKIMNAELSVKLISY